MAQQSLLWGTDGTGDATETGYTDTQLFTLFRHLFAHTANLGGVAPGLNKFAVSGTASPVAVASGLAIVYGIPLHNSASESVTIPTPASQTRIDRIVLRADWTAKTVRITRIAGTEGGSAPAMTQTAGTTWDIPLATVSITTVGVITVTDAREWLHVVGDGSVTTAKLADGAVTAAKMADYAVDPRTGLSGTNGVVADPENGNARGIDAVDLQTLRSASDQVASGEVAVIGGGNSNKASGTLSVVAGGVSNSASGAESSIGGGIENTAEGFFSFIPGGNQGKARLYSQMAHAAGRFSANGDAQRGVYVLRNSTANATPAELFLDGSSERLTIPSDSTWVFQILIVARRTDADNESAGYKVEGVIDNNAGTTALVGTVTKTVLGEDTAAWDVAVTADNTNDALAITVTGEAAKPIRWVASVWTVEVTG